MIERRSDLSAAPCCSSSGAVCAGAGVIAARRSDGVRAAWRLAARVPEMGARHAASPRVSQERLSGPRTSCRVQILADRAQLRSGRLVTKMSCSQRVAVVRSVHGATCRRMDGGEEHQTCAPRLHVISAPPDPRKRRSILGPSPTAWRHARLPGQKRPSTPA
ncbi:hypothetical protein FA09DRAFT_236943 [Tilletiopsis washingtonensis]|uniref:Uncharacterized protein n=1 Tax=Tilletiopsis washingtonensis TaxID=58919 RepID=A0A316ZCZ1_9BASI|nr:hypothetical protein FA09DRAFT_236943 [Tilletiopsis washingtonensis]PWN99560.1 hypothetical protein FA09DRAFT_236943 [Tilletiopsis washingtonensis]